MLIPRIVYCNQGSGDERIIKSKLNPSGQGGNTTAEVCFILQPERRLHHRRQKLEGVHGSFSAGNSQSRIILILLICLIMSEEVKQANSTEEGSVQRKASGSTFEDKIIDKVNGVRDQIRRKVTKNKDV